MRWCVQVKAFLQALAVEGRVAANTQNQALNARVFFYDQVLEQPLGEPGAFARAKRLQRLPVVLSRDEVKTAMIYTHVLNRGGLGVVSPLDRA